MKIEEIVRRETNSTVYNRARKIFLERRGDINCSRCPYHRSENHSRDHKYGRGKDKQRAKYNKENDRAIWREVRDEV